MDDETEGLIRRLRTMQGLGKLVGGSRSFRDAIAVLPAAAGSDAAVLITGETGTGKELVAHALHYLSERAAFPFVAVNCGALTDTLLEDELFGHARGAFTGADQPRAGLVAHAHRGTLFLDEIDCLTPRAQVALLRLLQDRLFRPVGSSETRRADVRFVAASNAALLDLVEHGRFRADLYYRLCVFPVVLPPLRERREDIALLAAHFLAIHARKGRGSLRLSPAATAALLAWRWPGNVRELENVMTRAARLCEGEAVEVRHLGLPEATPSEPAWPASGGPGPYRALKRLAIQSFERDYLIRLLRASEGNVTRAARLAGKERRDLGRLLKRHQLDPGRFVPARV
jgi:two-component system, NtrC family, response regulator GlrR